MPLQTSLTLHFRKLIERRAHAVHEGELVVHGSAQYGGCFLRLFQTFGRNLCVKRIKRDAAGFDVFDARQDLPQHAETGRYDAGGVARALDTLEAETPHPERTAAINLARRRRLGPFRPDAERAARRDKDLAVLARAGFPRDLSCRVIDAPDREALRALLADPDG